MVKVARILVAYIDSKLFRELKVVRDTLKHGDLIRRDIYQVMDKIRDEIRDKIKYSDINKLDDVEQFYFDVVYENEKIFEDLQEVYKKLKNYQFKNKDKRKNITRLNTAGISPAPLVASKESDDFDRRLLFFV